MRSASGAAARGNSGVCPTGGSRSSIMAELCSGVGFVVLQSVQPQSQLVRSSPGSFDGRGLAGAWFEHCEAGAAAQQDLCWSADGDSSDWSVVGQQLRPWHWHAKVGSRMNSSPATTASDAIQWIRAPFVIQRLAGEQSPAKYSPARLTRGPGLGEISAVISGFWRAPGAAESAKVARFMACFPDGSRVALGGCKLARRTRNRG